MFAASLVFFVFWLKQDGFHDRGKKPAHREKYISFVLELSFLVSLLKVELTVSRAGGSTEAPWGP